MAIRDRFIPQGWSSGFTKAAGCPVEEATLELSGAALKKQIPITYRYSPTMSTFIVECDAATWRRAGLDHMSDEESRAY